MQAFFANFPNKLTLNFPQNIVHQIFHEMSNILYIFRFSRFSNFSADFPQLYRIQIFQIFQTAEIFRRFSASSFPDFPPDFPLIFPLARFSASTPASQVFQIFHQIFHVRNFPNFPAEFSIPVAPDFPPKKRTGNFPVLPDHFGYTLKAIYPFVVLSAMFTAI